MHSPHLNHPSTHPATSDWAESQTLHVASAYINPLRWRTRRELFEDFCRHMEHTPNVRLHPVEVAFGDRPFEATDERDVQLRTKHELWLKENALNLCIARFPAGWEYGAYVDGDFTFTRHDWALEAIHLLQHFDFVQLYSTYTDLTGESATSWRGHRPYRMTSTFAWNYMHQDEFRQEVNERRARNAGRHDAYAKLPVTDVFPFGAAPGATGGAWAFRRDAFNAVGGLLDVCILGSADWHMGFGLVQATNVAAEMRRCTKPYVSAVLQWQSRAEKLQKNIGCVDQHAIHHFHGSKSRRAYGDRWHILTKHDYNPGTDIARDWQGLWQLTGNKPDLRDDLRRYFLDRTEDDCNLYGQESALV